MVKSKNKWPEPGKTLNWTKDTGQAKRRIAALASRKGNHLQAARALLSLSNVNSGPTGDKETARKARSDALYFFRQHNKYKKAKK